MIFALLMKIRLKLLVVRRDSKLRDILLTKLNLSLNIHYLNRDIYQIDVQLLRIRTIFKTMQYD